MIKKYKNDIILIGTLLLIAIIALVIFMIFKEDGKYVLVVVDEKEVASYKLDQNMEVKLSYSENSYNILVIEDGYAYIKDASCKDHICVKHNKIHFSGESIICLPNKTIIKIVSKQNEIDVVT